MAQTPRAVVVSSAAAPANAETHGTWCNSRRTRWRPVCDALVAIVAMAGAEWKCTRLWQSFWAGCYAKTVETFTVTTGSNSSGSRVRVRALARARLRRVGQRRPATAPRFLSYFQRIAP